MVEYFHHTKKEPADINDEVLKTTLVKNHDTSIRFIKAQEEKVLIPVKTEVDRIAWLKEKYGDLGAPEQLKAYAASVMHEYARNFKRPGIESGNDLLWFGKLEKHRYYSHKDPEVKSRT